MEASLEVASVEASVLEVRTKEELSIQHPAVVPELAVVDRLLRRDEFDRRINPTSA